MANATTCVDACIGRARRVPPGALPTAMPTAFGSVLVVPRPKTKISMKEGA